MHSPLAHPFLPSFLACFLAFLLASFLPFFLPSLLRPSDHSLTHPFTPLHCSFVSALEAFNREKVLTLTKLLTCSLNAGEMRLARSETRKAYKLFEDAVAVMDSAGDVWDSDNASVGEGVLGTMGVGAGEYIDLAEQEEEDGGKKGEEGEMGRGGGESPASHGAAASISSTAASQAAVCHAHHTSQV